MKKMLIGIAVVAAALAMWPSFAATEITPLVAFAETSYNGRPPSRAIDNSGLTDGCHGTDAGNTMWMGSNSGNTGGANFARWFVVDLGSLHSLGDVKVWNFNMANYVNRGLKQIDVYVSATDAAFSGTPDFSAGETWSLAEEDLILSKASGTADYAGEIACNLNGVKARWVGFWIDEIFVSSDDWESGGGYGGLSEIKFYEYEAPPSVDPADFAYRAEVTFPSYTGEKILSNFPVLIRLKETSGGFSYAQTAEGGVDIRFALPDGTPLDSEVDVWNDQGESLIWVRLPKLSVGTHIVMYWGGSATEYPASQIDGSVWKGASYVGVWHMEESGNKLADSAANELDGTPKKTTGRVADGIAGAGHRISSGVQQAQDGAGIEIPNYNTLSIGDTFAISGWIRYPKDQTPGYDRIFSRKNVYNSSDGWEVTMRTNSKQNLDHRGANGDAQDSAVFTNVADGEWHHLVVAYNGAASSVYVDGVQKVSGKSIGAAPTDNGRILVFGNNTAYGETTFKGALDEVRLRDVVTDADWAAAEYAAVATPSFANIGNVETISHDLPVITPPSDVVAERHAVTFSWLLRDAGVSAATVKAEIGTESGVYTKIVTLGSNISGSVSETATVSDLKCNTMYFLRLSASNGSGTSSSAETTFSTLGGISFSGESLSATGGDEMTATVTVSSSNPDVSVNAALYFGATGSTPARRKEWVVSENPQTFEESVSGLLLGNYEAHFEAEVTCSVCSGVSTVMSKTVTATLAGDCRWTGGANDLSWNTPGNWSSGTVPGPKDTAIFGTEASLSGETISLGASQTVAAIQIDSAGAFTIGSADDNTAGYVLSSARIVRSGGAAADVGTVTVNAEFDLAADTTLTVAEGAELDIRRIVGTKDLVLDGDGTVKMVQAGNRTAGKTEVKGGVLLISNNRQLGKELYIGGAGKTAVARSNGAAVGTRPFDIANSKTFVLDKGTFDLETDGISGHWEKELNGPITISNGGTFLPGKRRVQISTKSATVLTIAGIISGGTGGTIDMSDSTSLVVPQTADAAPVIQPHLTVTTGVKFDIGDIPNFPIDATISGGISYGWHPRDAFWKKGAGVLRLTAKSTYGGGGELAQGQGTTQIQEGTLLVDNDPTVYGSGTGNSLVRVDGGAVLGGTGRIGGLTETVTHWSGNNGTGANTRVTAKGTDEKQAVVWPGTIDGEDGSHVVGTLSVGVAELHHPVTFGDYSTLHIGIGERTADALVVNGAVDISETGTRLELAVVDELAKINGGQFTILSATDGITGDFADIVKPKSSWHVTKVNARQVEREGDTVEVYDALVASIPGRGLSVIMR